MSLHKSVLCSQPSSDLFKAKVTEYMQSHGKPCSVLLPVKEASVPILITKNILCIALNV